MKKVIAVLMMLAMMTMLLAACGSSSSSAAPASTAPASTADDASEAPAEPTEVLQLRMAHHNANDHIHSQYAELFAEKVKEATNGSIEITVFPNEELGGPDEIITQVQMGSIDVGLGGVGNTGKYSQKYNSINLPFLFTGYDHATATLEGDFYDWVVDDLEAQSFHILRGFWAGGFRHMTTTNKEINTPDDMKGLKIRVPSTKANQGLVTALGAVPETISFGELYTALSQGVVDGQENPLNTIYASAFYENQKFIALTYHLYDFYNIMFNLDLWNSLSADQQDAIQGVNDELAVEITNKVVEADDEFITLMEAEGVTFTYPDTAPFAALMDDVYVDLAADYSQENVDKMLEMAEAAK